MESQPVHKISISPPVIPVGVTSTKPKLGPERRYKVAIVAPTCFYYQVEMFRALAAHPRIDLTVYFCSDEALDDTEVQRMYKTEGGWGIESNLLDGYHHKFLKNYAPRPSYLKSLSGLMNFGIWREIRETRPDVVVLMSWMNPTWWTAAAACRFFKVPFLYLTDANSYAEEAKARWKLFIKKLLLGGILFRETAGALCAGTANRLLYMMYGIPEERLFPFAYSWGYGNLLTISGEIRSHRQEYRDKLGLTPDQTAFLFCGRMSDEKGLFHLLEAYGKVCSPRTALILVGDGALRERLQSVVSDNHLESVYFTGFQGRNEVLKYYAASDLLILPSLRDTWGIVVNEALCFGLPAIVSNEVGAGIDLVHSGYNGFRFPAGDIESLAKCLEEFMDTSEEERLKMSARSREVIRLWSERDLAALLVDHLESITGRGAAQDQPEPA